MTRLRAYGAIAVALVVGIAAGVALDRSLRAPRARWIVTASATAPADAGDIDRMIRDMDALNDSVNDHDTPNARRAEGLAGDLLRGMLAARGIALVPQIPSLSTDTAVKVFAKREIPCNSIPRERLAVLLIAGQSNASSEGGGRYEAKQRVINWNANDGKCYAASDPLLGTTGTGGSFATRLGDRMIESGRFDAVVIADVAVGGTFVHDWTPAGRYHGRLVAALDRLRDFKLPVTHMLWHQGEGDAGVHTPEGAYRGRLLSIVQSLRDRGLTAPVYVAVATMCPGTDEGVRRAQQSVVDGHTIFAGPDTDTLGVDLRMDGCHFNEAGLEAHAELWLQALH